LLVIRRLVRDLHLDVEIVGMPIVREPDGLALSSRNAYLSPDERRRALGLSRALGRAAEAYTRGLRQATALHAEAAAPLQAAEAAGELRLDYVELRDAETLAPVAGELTRPAVLAVAAFVGTTRLIDNRLLAN